MNKKVTTKAVAVKKNTALAKAPDQEVLDSISQAFPSEERKQFLSFPKLRMVSKDQTEGTGKNMKVTTEAGTFFTDVQDKEETEVEEEVRQKNGKIKIEKIMKRLWTSDELGPEVQGIIVFQRYQLKMWDQANERFISSAVYDKGDTDIPLFEGKNEIARGTPEELKAPYSEVQKGKDGKKDKTVSKLKDERVLFVWIGNDSEEGGQVYQMSVKGKSMYNYLKYTGEVKVPTVVTSFNSVPDEFGSNKFNTMTFEQVRGINATEAEKIQEAQAILREYIANQKEAFANKAEDTGKKEADEVYDNTF